MADHREAKQFSNIISLSLFFFLWKRWSSKSVTALITISFIQYLRIISLVNLNLDETKLKNLINFKFSIFLNL